MPTISRRQFLTKSATGAAALRLSAAPLGMPVGFQTWPVREMIGRDFAGALKQLAAVGYRSVEMCSPPGYADSGFGSLARLKGAEIRRIIEDAGLRCQSCHFGPGELTKNLEDRIAWSKELGLTQMILASFGLRSNASLDDWKRAADALNQSGEQTHKAGLQLGYHNHDSEFEKIGGVLVYDELLSRLDPQLVKMQFQVAVIRLGFEAAPLFQKYPGRFVSMHLADWSPSEKKMVPVGKGVVDWPKLFAAARTGGVKNYFVEVNNLDDMKASYPYLHNLKV